MKDRAVGILNKQDQVAEKLTNLADKYIAGDEESTIEFYKAEELYNIAFESFKFFENRKENQVKIRIDNSSQKDHDTIIEIVNDDMPFLVDSIAGKLDQ